jgi:hypothetical protein
LLMELPRQHFVFKWQVSKCRTMTKVNNKKYTFRLVLFNIQLCKQVFHFSIFSFTLFLTLFTKKIHKSMFLYSMIVSQHPYFPFLFWIYKLANGKWGFDIEIVAKDLLQITACIFQ